MKMILNDLKIFFSIFSEITSLLSNTFSNKLIGLIVILIIQIQKKKTALILVLLLEIVLFSIYFLPKVILNQLKPSKVEILKI